MRMHPRRGGESGDRTGERQRPLAPRHRFSDDDHMTHARQAGPREDLRAVWVERFIREVAVGVDQHGQTAAFERPPVAGAGGAAGAVPGAIPGPAYVRAPRTSCPGQRRSIHNSTGDAT